MRRGQATRQATRVLATTLALVTCTTATAAQTVTLHATLQPEHLGQGTTIRFSFQIAAPPNQVPPPLTKAEISYPVELAFALSELGLATCSPQTLAVFGIEGCPPNSQMGYGTALAEIPIGPSIERETAQVNILRATNQAGHLALLIYADAKAPISEQFIFPALILPATTPYGGRLTMNIPIIPGLPQGPDVAITQFHSTLGPLHLHYHEHKHGHTTTYEPKGIPLPNHCPHGGFRFTANFTFNDGTHTTASTAVPCPKRASDR